MKIGYVIATPEVSTPLMPAVQGAFADILSLLKRTSAMRARS